MCVALTMPHAHVDHEGHAASFSVLWRQMEVCDDCAKLEAILPLLITICLLTFQQLVARSAAHDSGREQIYRNQYETAIAEFDLAFAVDPTLSRSTVRAITGLREHNLCGMPPNKRFDLHIL